MHLPAPGFILPFQFVELTGAIKGVDACQNDYERRDKHEGRGRAKIARACEQESDDQACEQEHDPSRALCGKRPMTVFVSSHESLTCPSPSFVE